jgi:hypothetical protein
MIGNWYSNYYCNLVQKFRAQAQATAPSIRTYHKQRRKSATTLINYINYNYKHN